MIRFVGKSLGLAIAALLMGIGADRVIVRGQSGFVDEASHVPPSPVSGSSAPRPAIDVGSPPAAVTTPSPAAASSNSRSAAYDLRPLPHLTQPQPGSTRNPQGRTVPSKAGPYGAGGRRPGTAAVLPAGAAIPAGPLPAGSTRQAAHFDEINDPGFSVPVPPPSSEVPVNPLLFPRPRQLPPGPGTVFPTDRLQPPTIMGSHLGLQPGETATERSLRLMSAVGELEQQVDALGQRNAELTQTVKQRDDQLLLAIREIRSARKEVTTARDELERLRQQVKALQEKVRDAERDNADLLQTMAPLLQKLLETEPAGSEADETQE